MAYELKVKMFPTRILANKLDKMLGVSTKIYNRILDDVRQDNDVMERNTTESIQSLLSRYRNIRESSENLYEVGYESATLLVHVIAKKMTMYKKYQGYPFPENVHLYNMIEYTHFTVDFIEGTLLIPSVGVINIERVDDFEGNITRASFIKGSGDEWFVVFRYKKSTTKKSHIHVVSVDKPNDEDDTSDEVYDDQPVAFSNSTQGSIFFAGKRYRKSELLYEDDNLITVNLYK